MSEPLNPTLYFALERRFGRVRIANQGIGMSWSEPQLPTFDFSGKSPRPRRTVYLRGETYYVNCCFCNDTRGRLSFNHRWGVYDPGTRSDNLWLCWCFNEECTRNFQVCLQLKDLLLDVARVTGEMLRRPTRIARPGEVRSPGVMMPVDQLAKQLPHHPAAVYLFRRGFDLQELASRYLVCYSFTGEYEDVIGRIVFPIRENGKMVGWQARRVGDVEEDRLDGTVAPKYFTCPGFQKSRYLYGAEHAVESPVIAVVEGATDCWAAGPGAIALLGKTVSADQASKLCQLLRQHSRPVALALDPDQADSERRRRRPHHQLVALHQLYRLLGRCVFPVWLPPGSDPASLGRAAFWQVVHAAFREHCARFESGRV
jgi:hypothetical protein